MNLLYRTEFEKASLPIYIHSSIFFFKSRQSFKYLFSLTQEDKEPAFDSVKTILGMLEVSAEFAQNITFNQERIRKALPAGHLDATTLADYLVKKVSRIF